jgi:hypothetical protein
LSKRPNVLPIDGRCQSANLYPVTYTKAYPFYRAALRANPKFPRPEPRFDTVAARREWKMEMRAYDQALLDLGLATTAQLQDENAAVRAVPGFTPRIVRHSHYA